MLRARPERCVTHGQLEGGCVAFAKCWVVGKNASQCLKSIPSSRESSAPRPHCRRIIITVIGVRKNILMHLHDLLVWIRRKWGSSAALMAPTVATFSR